MRRGVDGAGLACLALFLGACSAGGEAGGDDLFAKESSGSETSYYAGSDYDPIPVSGYEVGLASATTTLAQVDSSVLDSCRVDLPGITTLSAESLTAYDQSLLNSSQQFDSAGSGEWDDNANYQRYLERISEAPVFETVDVSNRQFVVVVDRDGRGVPNCEVTLSDRAGRTAALRTLAAGRVPVFPSLYGLKGELRVQAECLGKRGHAKLSLDELDGVATVQLKTSQQTSGKNTLDLAFVLDVTGSMSAEIEAMKATIDAVASQVVATGDAEVRLALVAYRDYGDNPEFQIVDFQDDLDGFRGTVTSLVATGGGDTPEAVNQAMDWTTRLNWDLSATARVAFVIGDAPPHPHEDYSAVRSAAVLACGGIKVFTVATSGQSMTGRFVFRQMSQLSYATHLFLLRGGAAPDSKCADYQFRTGELHTLVIDRVKSELASQLEDPLYIPGLGADRDTEVTAVLDECAEEASSSGGGVVSPIIR